MAKDKIVDYITKDPADLMNANKHQSAVVYDLLSEGPIEGLDNGLASIYFNGTPIMDPILWNAFKPKRTANGLTCTTSNGAVTVPNDFSTTYHSLKDGDRYLRIQKALKELTGNGSSTGVSTTADSKTITVTDASFWTDAMLWSSTVRVGLPPYIRIPGAGEGGREYVGELLFVDGVTGTMRTPTATAVSYANIYADLVSRVTAYTDATHLTIETTPGNAVSSAPGQLCSPIVGTKTFDDWLNFEDTLISVRVGSEAQTGVPRHGNLQVPNAAYGIAPNTPIKQNERWSALSNIPANYNDTEMHSSYDPSEGEAGNLSTTITATGSGTTAMALAAPEDIDTVKITLQFPEGLWGVKTNAHANVGEKAWGHAEFQMFFEYKRNNAWQTSVQVVGPTEDEINARATDIKNKAKQDSAYHAWGPVNFNTGDGYSPNNGYITTYCKVPFFEEFIIPIEDYKPFDDWRIIIKKVTADNPVDKNNEWTFTNPTVLYAVEAQVNDWLHYPHSAYISTTVNASQFEGGAVPSRAFEIKGIKCQVPTNYNTRYELTSTSNASYTRNVTNGTNESIYQNWDGNFRGDKSTFARDHVNRKRVWTDNPAWIFYDLCTNKRYGLGEHISADDIDKYELYQIAQYCDELVPDGEGGTEPRYSANLYLTNSQQAYKVLKDMASMFRGFLYWHDGKLTATADRDKESVYTFTKGNVLGGLFSYEGSSKKLRTNQVKVTYNEPKDFYRQDVVIVEDTDDIADRNKIVSKSVVAYGCTSKSQALRYGKWVLLTEKLQKEVVNFTTGINAGYLRPGDVIDIQDADRSRVQFSGRVSNTGTPSTTSVPLDRSVTLASGVSYELSLIYPESGTYLVDTQVASYSGQTIGGHAAALDTLSGGGGYTNGSYTKIPVTGGTGKDLTVDVTVSSNAVSSISINNKGYGYTDNDAITLSNYGAFTTSGTKATCQVNGLASNTTGVKNGDLLTFIVSQDGASNLRNTTGAHLQTHYSDDVRLEKQPVNTSAGAVSTLTVAGGDAFTSAPNAEVIWSLTASTDDSGDIVTGVTGSSKKYQLVSIQETKEKEEYKISAIEYSKDKFQSIDRGWEVYTPPQIKLSTQNTTANAVPVPRNLSVEIIPKTSSGLSAQSGSGNASPTSYDADISWEAPLSSTSGIDTVYEDLAGYEIQHSFYANTVPEANPLAKDTVGPVVNSYSCSNINFGWYIVKLRTRASNGALSPPIIVEGYTGEKALSNVNRTAELPVGGELNSTLSISSGVVSIGSGATQTWELKTPTQHQISVTSASSAAGTQSFASPAMGASATAYLVVDASVPDLKAAKIVTDTTVVSPTSSAKTNDSYWSEVGASNNGLTAGTGSITMVKGETYILGSGTDFDGQFEVGGLIKVGNGVTHHATSQYFTVTKIEDDTNLWVSRPANQGFSAGTTIAYQSWKPNFNTDTIIAKITTDGSTNYTLDPLASYKADQVTGADIATTTITGSNIAAGEIDTAQIAANAITEAKIEANTITNASILANTITTASIASNSIVAASIVGGSITNAEIAGNTINAANILANSITSAQISAANGPSTSIEANSITSVHIAANQIGTSEIASNSVTAVSILANTVAGTQIAANSVNAVIVAQNAVTGVQIQTNAVVTEAIASNSVTSASVATNSIGAIAIVAGSITTSEIAADTIEAANIATDAIGSSEVSSNAIGAVNISTNSIGAEAIATNSIAALNIVSGSITGVEIAANAIDTAEIKSGSIDALHISSGAITTAKIGADQITTATINAGAIGNTELGSDAVDSGNIADGAIDTAHIAAGQITTAKIAALNITNALIAANAITEAKIQANTITNASILAGTIGNAQIAADAISSAKIAANAIDTAAIESDSIDTLHISAGSVTNAKISNMEIGKLTAGTLTVAQTVGSGGKITIDGANNRILIED